MRIKAIRKPIAPSDMLNSYKTDLGYSLVLTKYSTTLAERCSLAYTPNQRGYINGFTHYPYGRLFCWGFKSIRFHNPQGYPDTDILVMGGDTGWIFPHAFNRGF
jgi:hypothetical protein